MLLIDEYRKRKLYMHSGKITYAKAWNQIVIVLNSKGYLFTGKQCSNRFNTMKRTHKKIHDHNAQSGNNRKTWKYFTVSISYIE